MIIRLARPGHSKLWLINLNMLAQALIQLSEDQRVKVLILVPILLCMQIDPLISAVLDVLHHHIWQHQALRKGSGGSEWAQDLKCRVRSHYSYVWADMSLVGADTSLCESNSFSGFSRSLLNSINPRILASYVEEFARS